MARCTSGRASGPASTAARATNQLLRSQSRDGRTFGAARQPPRHRGLEQAVRSPQRQATDRSQPVDQEPQSRSARQARRDPRPGTRSTANDSDQRVGPATLRHQLVPASACRQVTRAPGAGHQVAERAVEAPGCSDPTRRGPPRSSPGCAGLSRAPQGVPDTASLVRSQHSAAPFPSGSP